MIINFPLRVWLAGGLTVFSLVIFLLPDLPSRKDRIMISPLVIPVFDMDAGDLKVGEYLQFDEFKPDHNAMESGSGRRSESPGLLFESPLSTWVGIKSQVILKINRADLYLQMAGKENNGMVAPIIPVSVLLDRFHIVGEARLTLSGMDAHPPGAMNIPLKNEDATEFKWDITLQNSGENRGTVWFHILMVPRDGGDIKQIPALAHEIIITGRPLLGLGSMWVRRIGVSGLILSLIIGFRKPKRKKIS
jgi:hypothetical protein